MSKKIKYELLLIDIGLKMEAIRTHLGFKQQDFVGAAKIILIIIFVTLATGLRQGNLFSHDPNLKTQMKINNKNSQIIEIAEGKMGIGVFKGGYWKDFINIPGRFIFDGNEKPAELLKAAPLLIIPFTALDPELIPPLFKNLLEQYVGMGGNIIVLAQNFGADYDENLPIPQGEKLKSYGWEESQSAFEKSIYFEKQHPVLSAIGKDNPLNANVDGYFCIYPSNSVVLLKSWLTRDPVLLYYPYGKKGGHVILTSLLLEAGDDPIESTVAEKKLLRDLITFAKKTDLSIPMFDLSEKTFPLVSLTVTLTNFTKRRAAGGKLMVYTPDRKTQLYQTGINVVPHPGKMVNTRIAFNLPALAEKDFGICHVDYELYDAQNRLIQLPVESLDGRFAVYDSMDPVSRNPAFLQWMTAVKEEIPYGSNIQLVLHLKNLTFKPVNLDIKSPFLAFNQALRKPIEPFNITIPPGQLADYPITVSYDSTWAPQPNGFMSWTIRLQYYDSDGVIKQIGLYKVVKIILKETPKK